MAILNPTVLEQPNRYSPNDRERQRNKDKKKMKERKRLTGEWEQCQMDAWKDPLVDCLPSPDRPFPSLIFLSPQTIKTSCPSTFIQKQIDVFKRFIKDP